jgi:hypothetical protein
MLKIWVLHKLEYMTMKRGGKKVLFQEKNVSNQITAENRKIIGVDIEITLVYFKKKKARRRF